MQTPDNSIRLRPNRNLLGLGPRLQTQEDADMDVARRQYRERDGALDGEARAGPGDLDGDGSSSP
jgi:hypothetical protein